MYTSRFQDVMLASDHNNANNFRVLFFLDNCVNFFSITNFVYNAIHKSERNNYFSIANFFPFIHSSCEFIRDSLCIMNMKCFHEPHMWYEHNV